MMAVGSDALLALYGIVSVLSPNDADCLAFWRL